MQSVAGSDEGLFALVAREWSIGHLPYTTVWECKPPLFFAMLTAALLVFGKSMMALRLATDAAVVATALALYFLGASLRRGGEAIGMTAALFYTALTISDSGLSAVAETFYVPFIAIPLAIVMCEPAAPKGPRYGRSALAIGVCLAGAILTKESAILDAGFVTLVVLARRGLPSAFLVALALAAGIAASIVPFLADGHASQYWDANVAALQRRALVRVPDVAPWGAIARAQALAFFPTTLLLLGVPWTLRAREVDPRERILIAVMLVWAAVDVVTVVAIGEYLGNHFIPAMAPLSVLGSIVTVRLAQRLRRPAAVSVLAVFALFAHGAYQFVLAAPAAYGRLSGRGAHAGDQTAQLADFINLHRHSNATLYVADDRTVLYVLTGMAPPTRYAYPPHLLDPYQEIVAGVDGPAEIARVLRSRPTYVVRDLANGPHENERGAALLDRAMARDYRPVFAIDRRIVYRLTAS